MMQGDLTIRHISLLRIQFEMQLQYVNIYFQFYQPVLKSNKCSVCFNVAQCM